LHAREAGSAKVLFKACQPATMLLAGSRGHGGSAELLLGWVSAKIAEHASCPC
jgi:nucleotide-binding universal stress UspA family protein